MDQSSDINASSKNYLVHRRLPQARRRWNSFRCILGKPSKEETESLIAREYARNRYSFIKRYNYDIKTEAEYVPVDISSPTIFSDIPTDENASPMQLEDKININNENVNVFGSPSKLDVAGSSRSSARSSPRIPLSPISCGSLQNSDKTTLRKTLKFPDSPDRLTSNLDASMCKPQSPIPAKNSQPLELSTHSRSLNTPN